MLYKNGNRTFYVSVYREVRDERGYIQIFDTDHITDEKSCFWLPEYVIDQMEYQFSWNRYEQDLHIPNHIKAIQTEIDRIEKSSPLTEGLQKSANDLKDYIIKLEAKRETQITVPLKNRK